MNPKHRGFALVVAVAWFFSGGYLVSPALAAETPASHRPNILVIMADDLGYADIGIHGAKDIPTPHIDSLARNGVRCTQGYVTAPQCAPSRCGLLTGRYQQRFGFEYNSRAGGIPPQETTIAEALKAAGYATGMIGKWSPGHEPMYHPLSQGFDEFFGFLGGMNFYLHDTREERLSDPARPQGGRVYRGTTVVDEREHLTDAFGREAVSFIERHGDEPFFLYVAFNAPHVPLEATPEHLRRFTHIADQRRRTYAAMIGAMDEAIGHILAALYEAGLEDNTLIVFLSDNGGPERDAGEQRSESTLSGDNPSDNGPLGGRKGLLMEGGIRVPFLVQWKGRLPAGKVYNPPVISLDILPISLALAGVNPPPESATDGVNLLPYLLGEKADPPHRTLYWRMFQENRGQWAIRQGDWKLYAMRDGQPSLFNLADDLGETRDLAAKHPEKVRALEAEWQKWNAQIIDPAWPPHVDKRKPR